MGEVSPHHDSPGPTRPGLPHVQGADMRTALCLACLDFITADKRNILEAARDHAIENLDTHRMTELRIMDVDTAAETLLRQALA